MSLTSLLDVFQKLPAMEALHQVLQTNEPVKPLLLPPAAQAPVLADIFRRHQVPILLLTGRVDSVSPWMQALEMWLPEDQRPIRLPEPTPLPYDRGPWSERTRNGRLKVLSHFMAGQHPQIPDGEKPPFVIASARAFLQKTIPKQHYIRATRVLQVGQIIPLKKLMETWVGSGYEPVSVVESAGQFSQRGGILDIFPVASEFPIRIELFGDEIDTLRPFDPATQRSNIGGNNLERVVIPPAREAMPAVAKEMMVSWSIGEENVNGNLLSWRDDIDNLRNGFAFENLEYYLSKLYPQPASLLDYLPQNGIVIIDDWPSFKNAALNLHDNADMIANEQPNLPPNFPAPIFDWDAMEADLSWWQPLILGEGKEPLPEGERPFLALAESFSPGPRFGGQVRPFLAELKNAQQENERVVVISRQSARLSDLWREQQNSNKGLLNLEEWESSLEEEAKENAVSLVFPRSLESLTSLPDPGTLTFINASLAEGFVLNRPSDNHNLLNLLTDAEIFGWNRPAPRRWKSPKAVAPETHFSDIQAGDYIVHLEYGIGLFKGLVSRNIGGMDREYLLLEYANGDVLYVPAHHADRLGKWIGADDRPPNINRLGEKSWTAAKAKAQRAADELAGELIELYAARETVAGHAFQDDTEWQAELEASFPYQETEDQLRVITEVKEDMERPLPMDRLICGDVGYGKTEVALRAAFKAVMDNKQVVMLVPTTVLAQQHFNTFKDRLSPFPVEIEMLSRFRTPTRQRQIVQKLRNGRIDIIIGTHRLLSDDISFKDLGLVIIDEEQRFGVAHKEKLKQWRTEVDVLTMTATPIPRTLYMSLTGVRDISIIDTAPTDRLPVQTFVGEADTDRLKRAIMRELDRGGQVFMVHNRVQTIDIIARQVQKLVPNAKIAIGHGQMSERQLERIMTEFSQGEIDILLSTTIIESGLDIPNANTIIIDRAEMFGLAQLYQLKGRVGRGARRAYAYFFHSPWRTLNEDAKLRLETIAENTDLGAGYSIAMRDMEIRGAGDLLGGQQSGHISAIGFDLYTRLLKNAVRQQRAAQSGERVVSDFSEPVTIDVPLAAYLPTDYIPEPGLRLRLYRRMALLDTMEDIEEMAEELADRFGPIPDPVHNLLYQLRIKALAQKAGVMSVTIEAGQIKMRLANLDSIDRYRLQRFLGEDVRVSKKAIWMARDLSTHEWQVALVQVLERLQDFDQEAMLAERKE